MTLRWYQQEAVDSAIEWLTGERYKLPVLIEAATGAGKSHIIAELAN